MLDPCWYLKEIWYHLEDGSLTVPAVGISLRRSTTEFVDLKPGASLEGVNYWGWALSLYKVPSLPAY